jgi:hypothetical protein
LPVSTRAIRADLVTFSAARSAVQFLLPIDEFSIFVNCPVQNLTYIHDLILVDGISFPGSSLTQPSVTFFFPPSDDPVLISVRVLTTRLVPVCLDIAARATRVIVIDFVGMPDNGERFPNYLTIVYGSSSVILRDSSALDSIEEFNFSPRLWTIEPSLRPLDQFSLYKPFVALFGVGPIQEGSVDIIETCLYCIAPESANCDSVSRLNDFDDLARVEEWCSGELKFILPLGGVYSLTT